MNLKDEIEVLVEEDSKIFEEVSDKIWEYAEMIYEEKQSCELQKQVMRDLGFTVNDQLPGLPTAFIASYGEGKPVIAILGEYDALANLSQEADCLEHKPIEAGKPGHGCGHNLLGMPLIPFLALVRFRIPALFLVFRRRRRCDQRRIHYGSTMQYQSF